MIRDPAPACGGGNPRHCPTSITSIRSLISAMVGRKFCRTNHRDDTGDRVRNSGHLNTMPLSAVRQQAPENHGVGDVTDVKLVKSRSAGSAQPDARPPPLQRIVMLQTRSSACTLRINAWKCTRTFDERACRRRTHPSGSSCRDRRRRKIDTARHLWSREHASRPISDARLSRNACSSSFNCARRCAARCCAGSA